MYLELHNDSCKLSTGHNTMFIKLKAKLQMMKMSIVSVHRSCAAKTSLHWYNEAFKEIDPVHLQVCFHCS